jgi:hypothetical protein
MIEFKQSMGVYNSGKGFENRRASQAMVETSCLHLRFEGIQVDPMQICICRLPCRLQEF